MIANSQPEIGPDIEAVAKDLENKVLKKKAFYLKGISFYNFINIFFNFKSSYKSFSSIIIILIDMCTLQIMQC